MPDESTLSDQGDNQMVGNDQHRARNERRGVPGETTQTTGVVETFGMMDPAKRAERRTGKKKKC